MKRKNYKMLNEVHDKVSRALEQVDAIQVRLQKLSHNLEGECVHEYGWVLAEAKAAHEFLIDAQCLLRDRLDDFKVGSVSFE